jgi:hypothetical protein
MSGVERVTAVATEVGVSDHLLDGLNPGDSLLRKRKAKRDGAYQFSVNVNRAAAHPLQNTCLVQRPPAELRQDNCLLGPDVLDYTEDFDLEFFDSVALENCASDTVQSAANILQRKKVLSSRDDHRSGNYQSRNSQHAVRDFERTSQPHSNHILMHNSDCPARWLETLVAAS